MNVFIGNLSNLSLKKASKEDVAKISNLFKICFKKINLVHPDEPVEAIKLIISKPKIKYFLEKLKKSNLFCLFKKNKLIATVGLEKNSVVCLYVHPLFIRRGIGSFLVSFIEEFAQSRGTNLIRLESTKTAFKFYKKLGYQKVGYKILNIGSNLVIKSPLMEKKLK